MLSDFGIFPFILQVSFPPGKVKLMMPISERLQKIKWNRVCGRQWSNGGDMAGAPRIGVGSGSFFFFFLSDALWT